VQLKDIWVEDSGGKVKRVVCGQAGLDGSVTKVTIAPLTKKPVTREDTTVTTAKPGSLAQACFSGLIGSPIAEIQSWVRKNLSGYRLMIKQAPMRITDKVQSKDIYAESTDGIITRVVCGQALNGRPTGVGEKTTSPITDAPITGAPITGAPITDAPITDAPQPYEPAVEQKTTPSPVPGQSAIVNNNTNTVDIKMVDNNGASRVIQRPIYRDDQALGPYYIDLANNRLPIWTITPVNQGQGQMMPIGNFAPTSGAMYAPTIGAPAFIGGNQSSPSQVYAPQYTSTSLQGTANGNTSNSGNDSSIRTMQNMNASPTDSEMTKNFFNATSANLGGVTVAPAAQTGDAGEDADDSDPSPSLPVTSATPATPRPASKTWLWVLLGLLGVAAAAGAYYYFRKPAPTDPAAADAAFEGDFEGDDFDEFGDEMNNDEMNNFEPPPPPAPSSRRR
jgi:hypothetical protein